MRTEKPSETLMTSQGFKVSVCANVHARVSAKRPWKTKNFRSECRKTDWFDFLDDLNVCAFVFADSDRFPRAPLRRRCPPAWSVRSLPQAGAELPAEAPRNSCCWESRSPPGRCHSNHRPEAGWPPRRSPAEGSPAEHTHKHTVWD